jgi:hypothetical protein
MVTLDRLVCLFTLTLASAACRGGHEASRTATLTITITGPGSVVLGAPVSRCRATCTIEVEQGSTVTLAPEPREGAALMSFSAPCGTEDCSVRVDADVSVSATFEWAPLPHVSRYTWLRIDKGEGHPGFFDLDSVGNAVGVMTRYAAGGPDVPARYDAVLDRVEPLPGAPEGSRALALNDDGLILLATFDGPARYKDGVTSIVPASPHGAYIQPWDLSERGWIVGEWRPDPRYFHPYRPWVHDGVTSEVWGNVTADTIAKAVNSDGRVVGSREVLETFPEGTTVVDYAVEIRRDSTELLPIGEPSSPHDLSDTGLVVGSLGVHGPQFRGFTYDLGTGALKVLEPLAGDIALILEKVNPSGTVAVGTRGGEGTGTTAVYFIAEDRLVDLESLVELPQNSHLASVRAVNVHGQILVAAYFYDDVEEPLAHLILTPEFAPP